MCERPTSPGDSQATPLRGTGAVVTAICLLVCGVFLVILLCKVPDFARAYEETRRGGPLPSVTVFVIGTYMLWVIVDGLLLIGGLITCARRGPPTRLRIATIICVLFLLQGIILVYALFRPFITTLVGMPDS